MAYTREDISRRGGDESHKGVEEERKKLLKEIQDREEAEQDDYIPREIEHSVKEGSCED